MPRQIARDDNAGSAEISFRLVFVEALEFGHCVTYRTYDIGQFRIIWNDARAREMSTFVLAIWHWFSFSVAPVSLQFQWFAFSHPSPPSPI